jgi:hypothetical protein
VDKEKKKFKGFIWVKPDMNDKISNIYIKFNEISEYVTKLMKEYKLLKIDDIFGEMVDKYFNKSLEEYLLLKNFIKENNKIDHKILVQYYEYIHVKGMYLIKGNQMTIESIIKFIKTQDIYYYDDNFNHNKNRDPDIFNYIKITSVCENYKENIKLVKTNELYK